MTKKEKKNKGKKDLTNKKANKEIIVENKGIFGSSIDYRIYHMNLKETILGGIIGFSACYFVLFVFYQSVVFGVIAGLAAMPIGVILLRKFLFKKRKRTLLIQFKDMLEALANSYATGKNTPDAFADSERDLAVQYGDNSYIVQEIHSVVAGIGNNYTVEDILQNFAYRSGLDDIQNFTGTFAACNRLGGNLKDIVFETRSIICEKIDIEMEISANIAEKKNELNLMAVMPVVIVFMLRFLGNEALVSNSFVNLIVKTLAIICFAGAYLLGRKITDIKI